jgi:hypothetical protein
MGLSLILFGLNAQARFSSMDEVVNHYVPQAQQVGEVRMKYLWMDIYDAVLYSPNGKFYRNDNFALQLDYLRSFQGEKIAESSIKEIKKQGFKEQLKLKQWLAEMKQIFPDVKKGDSLLGVKDDKGNSKFYYNGKLTGFIIDPEFTEHFFNIWLSEKSSYPEFSKKLIGK